MKRVQLPWPFAVVGALSLLLLGVGGAYLWMPRPVPAPAAAGVGGGPAAAEPSDGPLPDIAITLTDDALKKAGVVVSPVTISETTSTIRLSGVVEPDAYRQVIVAPLV